jgi:hypothetical protein
MKIKKKHIASITLIVTLITLSCSNIQAQSRHSFSAFYTSAFTIVNVTNLTDISIRGGIIKTFYDRKKPLTPAYGYEWGGSYDFKFKNNFTIGIGMYKSERKSTTGVFNFEKNPEFKFRYEYIYKSVSIPIRVGYSTKEKNGLSAVFGLQFGPDIFKSFEMPLSTINMVTGRPNIYISEKIYGINDGLARINIAIEAGLRANLLKNLDFSLVPKFQYSSQAFRIKEAGPLFVKGNMWLLGIQSNLIVTF